MSHTLFRSTGTAARLALQVVYLLAPASVAEAAPGTVATPPAVQAQCGTCHPAYPPRFLTTGDWKRVMATPERHYGKQLAMDEKARRAIEEFLVGNAGSPAKVGSDGTATTSTTLPRLTTSAWFKRKHHKLPQADWDDVRVGGRAQCGACHTRAGEGSYREREIVLPGGRRWQD